MDGALPRANRGVKKRAIIANLLTNPRSFFLEPVSGAYGAVRGL